MAALEQAPAPGLSRFVYRDLRRGTPPPAGELHLVSLDDGDRCLSRLIFKNGPDALPHGVMPIRVIVAKADPTFDDMLAATIAVMRLSNRPLPQGLRPFVEYATALRNGHYPGSVSPERSLAGLYQAIRWKYSNLTDDSQGRNFTDDWNQLAAVILAYAADGLDPFNEFPLPSSLFAEEQLFLAGDRDLYLRDKLAGETWQVVIPKGGDAARPALLLRQPQSRLWKIWARCDAAAGQSRRRMPIPVFGKNRTRTDGFDFLAVDEEGTGNWVFSTNPVHGLSIRTLRDRLQKEEKKYAPEQAATDPWVSLYDHTLVAAPRAGSAIPEKELITLVKQWANARVARPTRLLAGSAAMAILGGAILFGLVGTRGAASPSPETVVVKIDQPGMAQQQVPVVIDQSGNSRISVNVPPRGRLPLGFQRRLPAPRPMWLSVQANSDKDHPLTKPVSLRVNDDFLGDLPLQDDGHGGMATEPKAVFLRNGENVIAVQVTNEYSEELPVDLRIVWDENRRIQPKLYALAVGTRFYRDPSSELGFAEADAGDLAAALHTLEGPDRLFQAVVGQALLHPTKAQLFQAIDDLKGKAKASEGAMVWISVAGHGEVDDGQFTLILHGGGKGADDERISWADLFAKIDELRCPVVVLLDTCASGQVHRDVATVSKLAFGNRSLDWGRVLISASYGRAHESSDWGHSAVCLATLECIKGKYLIADRRDVDWLTQIQQTERPFVTLKGFSQYLDRRVEQLYRERTGGNTTAAESGDQRVDVSHTPSFDLRRIAIAPDESPKAVQPVTP